MSVRTRIEPSPSGSIHVGNARTALFNWLFARHHDGAFILRISDTDAKRATEENFQTVLRDMKWLGLTWDEGPDVGGDHGPYRQSERFDIYREWARRLVEEGLAYEDYATPEDIDAERKRAQAAKERPDHRSIADARRGEGGAPSIRFIVPIDRTITFQDAVLGEVSTDLGRTPDFVILRSDGTPTYMLAVTVDDVAMEITHVIRGNDLAASTPRQILLREAMGVTELPVFAHLPLLVDERGRPLSKRWGDVSIAAYRDQGYLPEAMVNYMSLLGWSLDDRTNIFSVDQAIETFTLERVNRNPAAFDVTKLEWVNGHYIRSLGDDVLAERIADFIGIYHKAGRELVRKVTPLITERMKRLDEAEPMVRFLFGPVEPDDKARKALAGQKDYLGAVVDRLWPLSDWTVEAIEGVLRKLAEERELKPKHAFQPIRAAVTGTLVSPPLFESLELLGREETMRRLRRAAGRD